MTAPEEIRLAVERLRAMAKLLIATAESLDGATARVEALERVAAATRITWPRPPAAPEVSR